MFPQNTLQALVDGMSAQWQKERAATQMTLGAIIKDLESRSPDFEVKGLGHLYSYRGYYSDLAFSPTNEPVKASVLLERCKAAMGRVFEGYKGGEYVMGELTPLWIAHYGSCGDKLMSINDDGSIATAKEIF